MQLQLAEDGTIMKIIKHSLEEQAATYLRTQILDGKFEMGAKLVESMLAKNLELSRSTIRMALNTLAHEGLVVQKPYVGWQVIDLTEGDLLELYDLRVALETRAAWLAAERINEEGQLRLRELMNHYLYVGRSAEVTGYEISKIDLALHTLIIELSDNQRFSQIYQNMANQILIYFNIDHWDHDPKDSAESHLPLVEAICNGDSETAQTLAGEHITTFPVIGLKFRKQHSSSH
jgi:DNA-binding GntR family transcriptional regulator